MSPRDIVSEILIDPRRPDVGDLWHGDAILLLTWIVMRLERRALDTRPLSPLEIQRIELMLEMVGDAVRAAKTRALEKSEDARLRASR